jgi:hypothetical protein
MILFLDITNRPNFIWDEILETGLSPSSGKKLALLVATERASPYLQNGVLCIPQDYEM